MTVVAHAFTEQNSNQSTTSTSYGDVSGAAITSPNLTAGKKYLLWMSGQGQCNNNDLDWKVQAVHGSTAFANSEHWQDQPVPTARRQPYAWFTVWTAVDGEDVKLQFSTDAGGTAQLDQIAQLALNLSDDLVENVDWVFAEDAVDLALTTSYQGGASITINGQAGDWLVLTCARIDPTAGGANSFQSRIQRSGEAASTLPQNVVEPQGASSTGQQVVCARVFNIGSGSNTFAEQSASTPANAHTRLHSAIFALKLSALRNHAFAYTEGALSLGTAGYGTELQTLTLTPDLAGDVVIASCWGFDLNDVSRYCQWRTQVDNSDQPAGQTTDAYTFKAIDARDEVGLPLLTMPNLTAAAHTIDLDASVDATTGTPAALYRLLCAFTMEFGIVRSRTTEPRADSGAVTRGDLVRYVDSENSEFLAQIQSAGPASLGDTIDLVLMDWDGAGNAFVRTRLGVGPARGAGIYPYWTTLQ